MNRVFTAALLLTLLCAPVFPRQQPAAARLIDSFGEIYTSDLKARLDNFAVELQTKPGAKGVVVTYAAKNKFPGWPVRRADLSVDYLINSRGIDAARISVLNGGLRDDTLFELWVLPPGAELNVKPFDVSLLMSGEKTPLPFDRFIVIEHGEVSASESEAEPYPDNAPLYEYFVEALRRDPTLRGCIIGYTSRRGSRAADRRIASLAKLTMAKSHAVDIRRIVALGGGRREYKMVELWLVPPGAALPVPTPTVRASRRRRR
jgi:hypothetical protein